MKINTVLFDLDGTLLPMDLNVFTRTYLGALANYLADYGYEPKKLADSILVGTAQMLKNDGRATNESVFWNRMTEIYGENILADNHRFEAFYRDEFDKVRGVCGYDARAAESVGKIKEMGLAVVLATNPLFPSIATEKRIAWAGLTPDEFVYFTSYENSSFSKPNPNYYREIINKLRLDPEKTLMVGNDVDDDMIAATLGMKVFLLTDNLINGSGKDVSDYPSGSFEELIEYVKSFI